MKLLAFTLPLLFAFSPVFPQKMTEGCIGELLNNGGLECLNTETKYNFEFFKERKPQFQFIDSLSKNVHSGDYAAKFNDNSGISRTLWLYGNHDRSGKVKTFVPVKYGEKYALSYYIKAHDSFYGSGIYSQFIFNNARGENVGFDQSKVITVNDLEDSWKKVTFHTTIPEGVNSLGSAIYYKGGYPIWIDDITLELISKSLNYDFEQNLFKSLSDPTIENQEITNPYFSLESDLEYTYRGKSALRYNADSGNSENNSDFISRTFRPVKDTIKVFSNDSYVLSAFVRVNENFKGDGIRLLASFFDRSGHYIANTKSDFSKSTFWEKITLDPLTVPSGAYSMIYELEFSGNEKAWADNIKCDRKNYVYNSGFQKEDANFSGNYKLWKIETKYNCRISRKKSNSIEVKNGICFEALGNSNRPSQASLTGPFNELEKIKNSLSVTPNETYKFSADIYTNALVGKGVKMVLLLFKSDGTLQRIESPWHSSKYKKRIDVQVEIPKDVHKLKYAVEFSASLGEASFENLLLEKISNKWYDKTISFEKLEQINTNKKREVSEIKTRFENYHAIMESNYCGNGKWSVGNDCPWVRLSANAAIGYINASRAESNSKERDIYLMRSREALNFLLEDQKNDGSFAWHRLAGDACSQKLKELENCKSSPYTKGSVNYIGSAMYEGSIASVALLTGYTNRTILNVNSEMALDYLKAAKNFCDYLLDVPINRNANFNAFALWSLSEYMIVTQEYDKYYFKALEFYESMAILQRESGFWYDAHNQKLNYHGILSRGLVNFYRVLQMRQEALDGDHIIPKMLAVKSSMFRAINHTIRSQREGKKVGNGYLMDSPESDVISQVETLPMDALLYAYTYLNYNQLVGSLNEYTTTALNAEYKKGLALNIRQGHRFASLGLLWHLYY